MNTLHRLGLITLGVAALLTPAVGRADADDSAVNLAGRGPRREALTAMQYKPFDNALWADLTDWSTSKPLTAEAVKGKPVLIVTWASWFRASHAGLKSAQALAGKYESQGLITIAVHNQRTFENAKKTADEYALTIPYAHDAKGEFATALKMDGAGPEFYLIDRAGRLRFAGVNRDSVDAATALLVKETPAEAAAATAPAPKSPSAADPDARDNGQAPTARGVKLPPSAYAGIAWPKKNTAEMSAKDLQGKPFPGQLSKAKYLSLVPNTEGKIIVLDFWATWCGPCKQAIPHLEKLAKQYENDVAIIGLTSEDETTVKKFLAKGRHEYFQALDTGDAMNQSLSIRGIPHVVVLSTDGIIRYQGNPYPSADLPGIQSAVAALVKVDPGVLARQKADQAGQNK